jgi:hypothetical protein
MVVRSEEFIDFDAAVAAAFLPMSAYLWKLLRFKDDGEPQFVHQWQRRRLAQTLVTAVGLWYCLLEMSGLNLRARVDRSSLDCSLYADHMVMYHLCDSIRMWNRLDGHRLHDEYDIDVARALVRFLDLAIAMEYGADIFKRSLEAAANLLETFPMLWETMIDEAGHCACSDGLIATLGRVRPNIDR